MNSESRREPIVVNCQPVFDLKGYSVCDSSGGAHVTLQWTGPNDAVSVYRESSSGPLLLTSTGHSGYQETVREDGSYSYYVKWRDFESQRKHLEVKCQQRREIVLKAKSECKGPDATVTLTWEGASGEAIVHRDGGESMAFPAAPGHHTDHIAGNGRFTYFVVVGDLRSNSVEVSVSCIPPDDIRLQTGTARLVGDEYELGFVDGQRHRDLLKLAGDVQLAVGRDGSPVVRVRKPGVYWFQVAPGPQRAPKDLFLETEADGKIADVLSELAKDGNKRARPPQDFSIQFTGTKGAFFEVAAYEGGNQKHAQKIDSSQTRRDIVELLKQWIP